jgi:hypothetical protein
MSPCRTTRQRGFTLVCVSREEATVAAQGAVPGERLFLPSRPHRLENSTQRALWEALMQEEAESELQVPVREVLDLLNHAPEDLTAYLHQAMVAHEQQGPQCTARVNHYILHGSPP